MPKVIYRVTNAKDRARSIALPTGQATFSAREMKKLWMNEDQAAIVGNTAGLVVEKHVPPEPEPPKVKPKKKPQPSRTSER